MGGMTGVLDILYSLVSECSKCCTIGFLVVTFPDAPGSIGIEKCSERLSRSSQVFELTACPRPHGTDVVTNIDWVICHSGTHDHTLSVLIAWRV